MKIYQEMPQSTVPSTLAHNLKNPYQKKQHKQKNKQLGIKELDQLEEQLNKWVAREWKMIVHNLPTPY